MFLLPLLLSAELNMSLPEFTPGTDLSGNYIVSSYDVSSDEFGVEYIPSDRLVLQSVDSGSNDDIVNAINESISHNDSYWELFLDSYTVEETQYLVPSYLSQPYTWRFESNGSIGIHPQANDSFAYVPVSVGYEYSVYNLSGLPSGGLRIGVVDSLTSPSVVTNFSVKSDLDSFTFYPSQNGYLVVMSNQHGVVPNYQASYVLQRQESYTLSELGNAVVETQNKVESLVTALAVCEFCLIFMCCVPNLRKSVNKLMNKKED